MHIRKSIVLAATLFVGSLSPLATAHALVPGAEGTPTPAPQPTSTIMTELEKCQKYEPTDQRFTLCFAAVYAQFCETRTKENETSCNMLEKSLFLLLLTELFKNALK